MATVTPEGIRALAATTDPAGVLSVYIDTSPGRLSRDIVNFTRRVRGWIDDLAKASPELKGALPRLQAPLDELLEVTDGHGRGRALVAGVGGGEPGNVFLPVPVADTVALDRRAIALPLVQAAGDLAPSGIVVLSRGGVRILEITAGQPEELSAVPVVPTIDDDGNERRPRPGARSAPQGEDHARAIEDDVARAIRSQGPRVRELSERRHWAAVVIAGDPRLRQLLVDHAEIRPRVLSDDRDLASVTGAALAEAVEPRLAADRAERRHELFERARDGAGAGTLGAVGLNDVGAALLAGRVAHLVIGYHPLPAAAGAAGGRIVDRADPPGDVAGEELQPIDAAAEELARRALDTDAEVTCLPHGETADALATMGGVAATLRW
jgi:hypothetical protein